MDKPLLTPFGNPMPPALTAEQKAWADGVFAEVAAKLGVPPPQRTSSKESDAVTFGDFTYRVEGNTLRVSLVAHVPLSLILDAQSRPESRPEPRRFALDQIAAALPALVPECALPQY